MRSRFLRVNLLTTWRASYSVVVLDNSPLVAISSDGRDKGTLTQDVRQGNLVYVQIADSARSHGVRDGDIDHAIRHPLRVVAGEGRDLVIGPDRSGRLLEVVILDDDPDEEPS